MKYYKYTICRADGSIESCRVPKFFSPYQVAEQLPHSMVFVHFTGKGWQSTLHGEATQLPAWFYVGPKGFYYVPWAPKDEKDASLLWRNYVNPIDEFKAMQVRS